MAYVAIDGITYIYKIDCCVEGVGSYIGRTNNVERRWGEHKSNSSGRKLVKAIKKYGKDCFIINVLETCDNIEQAKQAELFYMRECNTIWPAGLNVVGGGEGIYSTESYEHVKDARTKGLVERWSSEANRERQSKTLKAKMNSPEIKQQSSEAAKRRWADPEYRKKQAEALERNPRTHSEATRKKMSESRKRVAAEKGLTPGGKKPKYGSVKNGEITRKEIVALILTPEERERQRILKLKHRDVTVKNATEMSKKYNKDPETIAKRAAGLQRYYALHGKPPVTQETRDKMSLSHTVIWAKMKEQNSER